MPVPIPTPSSSLPVQLHRIRFLDYTPSPITALSFSPLPLPPPESISAKGKEKAIEPEVTGKEELGPLILARENGSVEIWEWSREDEGGVGNWILEKILPPTLTHPSVTLMALAIRNPSNFHRKSHRVPKISDLRLFTAGSDSTELVERCLLTGRVLHTYSIPSPPLWSLSVSPTHTLLCLSTTAQNLSFLSIPQDSSPLQPPPSHLLRSESLPSRTRTVSVAWGPPRAVQGDGDEWEWRDTYLVTGNSDSSFRKWEIPKPLDGSGPSSGRLTLKGRAVVEKLHKGNRGGRRDGSNVKGTIVWGVGVLPDHTIVTSDSLGSVTFWDGSSMAQKQHFPAHKADGMCLVIGPSGKTVYAAGPDQRVCQFTRISTSTGDSWQLTSTRRIHSHDVRALSIFPPYVPVDSAPPVNPEYAPILASGGWDMSLSLTPAAPAELLADKLRNPLGKVKGMSRVVFEESFARKMTYLGGAKGTGMVSVSRGGRLVAVRKERSVGIWRIHEDEQGWAKVLEMDLRLRTNLISCAISNNGAWLAVSDLYETKLFRLVHTDDGLIQPKRIATMLSTLLESSELSHLSFETSGTGSSSLLFTPDSNRLILGLVHSQVVVLELAPGDEDDDVRVMKCFRRSDSLLDGRILKNKKRRWTTAQKDQQKAHRLAKQAGRANGDLPNGHAEHGIPRADGRPEANGHVESEVDMEAKRADKRARRGPRLHQGRPNGLPNGHSKLNGDVVQTGTNDGSHADPPENDESEDDSDEPAENEPEPESTPDGSWITSLAASADGQWLAAADLLRRVYILNLDTLQQVAILPTLPYTPLNLAFPPSHPSLLTIIAPTGSLTFYHIEHRRLLPPTSQIMTLNQALREQYTPAQGAIFEPIRSQPRSAKVVIWSHDWMCTARLDLEIIGRQAGKRGNALLQTTFGLGSNGSFPSVSDPSDPSIPSVPSGTSSTNLPESPSETSPSFVSRSLRRKRAREAREALELISQSGSSERTGTPLSGGLAGLGGFAGLGVGVGAKVAGQRSSKDDPEFYKISTDRFRSVAAVEWLKEGEMMVVERPMADFVGELPPAFWTAGFGRA